MTTNLATRNHTHELSHSCQESAVELLGPLFRVSQDWDGVTVEALVFWGSGALPGSLVVDRIHFLVVLVLRPPLPCWLSTLATPRDGPLSTTLLAGPLLHISPSSFNGSPDLARSTQVNLLVIQSQLFRDLIYIYKIPFALRWGIITEALPYTWCYVPGEGIEQNTDTQGPGILGVLLEFCLPQLVIHICCQILRMKNLPLHVLKVFSNF